MDFWYRTVIAILKVYTSLFIRDIHVCGEENIPSGPKIIVANHPNATDGFMLPFVFHEKLHFLIQDIVFDTPIIGKLLTYADQIPVIAGKGRQALAVAKEILIEGGSVVIFPEGRLNNDVGLHRAGIGAAMLAVKTGAPMLPLGVYVPPESLRTFKANIEDRISYSRWQMGGTCFIRIGQPMQMKWPGKKYGNLRQLTDQIMIQINELVSQAKFDADDEGKPVVSSVR